jgi:hypothetical protein
MQECSLNFKDNFINNSDDFIVIYNRKLDYFFSRLNKYSNNLLLMSRILYYDPYSVFKCIKYNRSILVHFTKFFLDLFKNAI